MFWPAPMAACLTRVFSLLFSELALRKKLVGRMSVFGGSISALVYFVSLVFFGVAAIQLGLSVASVLRESIIAHPVPALLCREMQPVLDCSAKPAGWIIYGMHVSHLVWVLAWAVTLLLIAEVMRWGTAHSLRREQERRTERLLARMDNSSFYSDDDNGPPLDLGSSFNGMRYF